MGAELELNWNCLTRIWIWIWIACITYIKGRNWIELPRLKGGIGIGFGIACPELTPALSAINYENFQLNRKVLTPTSISGSPPPLIYIPAYSIVTKLHVQDHLRMCTITSHVWCSHIAITKWMWLLRAQNWHQSSQAAKNWGRQPVHFNVNYLKLQLRTGMMKYLISTPATVYQA